LRYVTWAFAEAQASVSRERGRVSSILPGVFPLGKFCHCLTLICYLLYAQKTGIFLMDHRRLVPGLTRQSGRASPGELTGMSGSVCLSTCLSVCLSASISPEQSAVHYPFVHITCLWCSVLLCRRCDTFRFYASRHVCT